MKKLKKGFFPNRRQIIKAGLIAGGAMMVPWRFLPAKVFAAAQDAGMRVTLSDPAAQPKFMNPVPNALDPAFVYNPYFTSPGVNKYSVRIAENSGHTTGLIGPLASGGTGEVTTPIYGYAAKPRGAVTWPGMTFEVTNKAAGGPSVVQVDWYNELTVGPSHLLPVDTNLHWCYALHGYMGNTIETSGVPIITHLHGGHTDFQFDGNPEFFYNPGATVVGPQWRKVRGGFTNSFVYDNQVRAGNLWYHDHALGITRLNVYAGLAGFYFVRDDMDTGLPGNPLGLPAGLYEKAYAIQDRMFKATGELFYPAFYGDPAYVDFIVGEGAILPNPPFPVQTEGTNTDPGALDGPGTYWGGPTALAEFFGDHMVVNGKIWPKDDVEPRNYRMHLLNGTDSRFMGIEFWQLNEGDDLVYSGNPNDENYLQTRTITNATRLVDFITVIGSDQGLADSPTTVTTLLSEPGSRYDIIVNFSGLNGRRIIMRNVGGDEPFGDSFGEWSFECTDRIMAFDVSGTNVSEVPITLPAFVPVGTPTRTRKVALFEGMDEFGRLQPLLGTAEAATDYKGKAINWPNTPVYQQAKLPDGTLSPLVGPIEGSVAWHSPTTENPALGDTEEWEIWNMTGDAHPIHLHLVHFEVLGRQEINFDSEADEDGFVDGVPADNGVYRVPQPTVQHNSVAGDESTYGMGFKIIHPTNPNDAYGPVVSTPTGVVENTPKDMVTALPGQITRIKMTFDKPGRYVWHCHILSHEDHEMMRVLHVGMGA